MAEDRRYREEAEPRAEERQQEAGGEERKPSPAKGAARPKARKAQTVSRGPGNLQRLWMGLAAVLLFVAFFVFEGMDNTTSSEALKDATANGVVGGVAAGTVLSSSDEQLNLTARDFQVKMKEGTTSSRLLVWDFAAEDGDVVTIKVNGAVVSANVGLLNKPVAIDVPVPSVIEVVGVKDGVGGITYGIKIPGAVGNKAYFNVAPEGSANKYTLGGF